ncbi:MAG: hypothetical protein WC915_04660 [archaeon]|jgi:hypothetical protein
MFELVGLEVIVLVTVVAAVLFLIVKYNSTLTQKLTHDKEEHLEHEKEKLKSAEKKYMQGKIKQDVFAKVKDELNYKIVLTELDIYRIKKIHTLEIEEKAEKLIQKLVHPTKHRKITLRHMLIESELVRKELKIIENKLLKNEIDQELFKRLISEKEDEMLEKENQIIHFVKSANSDMIIESE